MAKSLPDGPFFVCSSGKLLWGQLHCIAEGHLSDTYDAESAVPDPSIRGTIVQRDFSYAVNAARGEWNVADIMYRAQPDQSPSLAGFVIYSQEIADPAQILKDCANAGMRSSHSLDKSIIYVNRYDWGLAHEVRNVAEPLLSVDDSSEDDLEAKVKNMMSHRMILADASNGLAVINQLKVKSRTTARATLIKDSLVVGHKSVGVHLACPDTEYELGWMVFSGSKKGELIAFVYDGAYTGLEGDIFLKN